MKTHKLASICSAMALLGVQPAVQAATPSHDCALVHDDARRLACYDAAYGKPARVAASNAADPSSVQAQTPAVAIVPPVQKPAASPADQPARSQTDNPVAAPVPASSTVATLRRLADGRFQATLQNGDSWVQLEPDRNFEIAAGDAVTIRAAMLGSFVLVANSGNTTRVRRLK